MFNTFVLMQYKLQLPAPDTFLTHETTDHGYFQASTEDIHFHEILMTKRTKCIRDFFE